MNFLHHTTKTFHKICRGFGWMPHTFWLNNASWFTNCCIRGSTSASKNCFQISQSVVSRVPLQIWTLKSLAHPAALVNQFPAKLVKAVEVFCIRYMANDTLSLIYCLLAPLWAARKPWITCILTNQLAVAIIARCGHHGDHVTVSNSGMRAFGLGRRANT